MSEDNPSPRLALSAIRPASTAVIGAWLLLAGVIGLHYITSDIVAAHYLSIALAVAAVALCGSRLSALQGAGLAALVSIILLGDALWFGAAPHELTFELISLIALPLVLGLVRSAAVEAEAGPTGYYWDTAAETSMGRYITEAESSFIADTIAALDGELDCIVDAGAGTGRLSGMLAVRARRVLALETNADLTPALSRVASNVTAALVSPEATRIPVRDGSADVVVCIEVPDLAQHAWFWHECSRVLKPSGRLVLTLQNRRSWKGLTARADRGRYRSRYGAEYYGMSFDELVGGLRSAGLEVESANGYNWLPFRRGSDSPFVRPLAAAERLLGLRALSELSPWVILAARRSKS
jgi:SAM-dependent methyltransferase